MLAILVQLRYDAGAVGGIGISIVILRMVLVCACIGRARSENLRLLNQRCRTHWQLRRAVLVAEPQSSVARVMPSVSLQSAPVGGKISKR